MNRFTLILGAVAVLAVGAMFLLDPGGACGRRARPAPALDRAAAPAAPETAVPQAPAPLPGKPLATVDGSEQHTHLELLRLRRTGPKVVTATLRASLDRKAESSWWPEFQGPDGEAGTAAGLVLVDEINGREHFPLHDPDGNCLCSRDLGDSLYAGDTAVFSAKFPAPPADVPYASLQTPGFPSFDRVPLGS